MKVERTHHQGDNDAWTDEFSKFTGTEMKIDHRAEAAGFLRANRDAVLARTDTVPPDVPPALHFDPRWGGRP